MFWGMVVSVIVRKEARMSMFLILSGHRGGVGRISRPNPLYICLWGWMRSDVYKREVDIRDELLVSTMDAAARIQKRELQLRRRIRD
jgi:hypothetical protein